ESNGLDVAGYQIGRDFINVWSGPQLAFGGKLATLFDLRAYHAAIGELFGQPLRFHNWGYPLFTLPAFWPLAQLPYFAALAVWTFGLFGIFAGRSEEHTSELQSHLNLVCRLLLEKKKINKQVTLQTVIAYVEKTMLLIQAR